MKLALDQYRGWRNMTLMSCRLWREQIRWCEANPTDPRADADRYRNHLRKEQQHLARLRRKWQGIFEPIDVRVDLSKSHLKFVSTEAEESFHRIVAEIKKPFDFKDATPEVVQIIKQRVNELMIFMFNRGQFKLELPEVEVWQ